MRLFFVLSLLFSSSAFATVVLQVPMEQLVKTSSIIVHGTVLDVQNISDKQTFQTQIKIKILEPLKGIKKTSGEIVFNLPGGEFADRQLRIPGMPIFKKGENVVVLLENTPNGELIPTGLSQGVFYIRKNQKVERLLQGVHLYDQGKINKQLPATPSTLKELLQTIKGVR